MDLRGDLFLVALELELEQAVENLAAGGLADGLAQALFGIVEAVTEFAPAVGGGDGLVQLGERGSGTRTLGGIESQQGLPGASGSVVQ